MLKFLLPALFIGVPIAEIAAFIQVGGLIGLWPTLLTIVLTALIGTAILRHQGLATLSRAQSTLNDGRLPLDSVVDAVFLLVAGLLLLTPGFLTDAVGFILLVPGFRRTIAKTVFEKIRASGRFEVHSFSSGGMRPDGNGHGGGRGSGPVIDGEAVEITDPPEGGEPDPSSPWRK